MGIKFFSNIPLKKSTVVKAVIFGVRLHILTLSWTRFEQVPELFSASMCNGDNNRTSIIGFL